MAKSLSVTTLCLILLALTLGLANSARLLDDVTPDAPVDLPPLPGALPSVPVPAVTDAPAETPAPEDQPDQPQPNPDDNAAPASIPAPEVPAPEAAAVTPAPATTGASQTGAAGTASGAEHPAISFYMHDVLGGSHATGRIVTGLIATEGVNGIPFSRPNNQVFPVTNGVPLVNNNFNNLINNNNVPFVAGLNGQNQQQTVLTNAGTNNVVNGNNNNQAFVTPGQLPSGVTLQNLMFGSITVIDDELTEGHELGSGVLGRGQGFYLASSLDGESHTMAFTTLFHGEQSHEDDTISFFGVHRTASPISQIAVIGGTGKYENAKGYATIEALPQQDQHTTDGVDTIAHINVYLY